MVPTGVRNELTFLNQRASEKIPIFGFVGNPLEKDLILRQLDEKIGRIHKSY